MRYAYANYEPYESKLFAAMIHSGSVVLDIGAGWGHYSVIASRIVGRTGKVYAFEPDPVAFRALLANVRESGSRNVMAFPLAVGNEDATKPLWISGVIGGQSIYSKRGQKATYVRCVELDRFLRDQLVDLVKMDIDGGELYALEGMESILQRNRRLILIMEFASKLQRESGRDPQDLIRFLHNQGFVICLIDERRRALVQTCSGSTDGNILCFRQDAYAKTGELLG